MVDVAIVYRNNGPWGAGKGAPLQSTEADENLYNLAQAIASVVAQAPIEIASINVVDNQMTIVMEDYTIFGPFTLPTATFNMRGAWEPDTLYAGNDIFTATYLGQGGLYMADRAFTSQSGSFNPSDGDIQGPFAHLLIPYQTLFDIGFFYPAQPGYGIGDEYEEDIEQPMFQLLATRDFYLGNDFEGSLAKLDIGPTDLTLYRILKNGLDIGDIQFAAAETDGTFSGTGAQFSSGDLLTIYRPEVIDDTAYNLTITLVGALGEMP